MKTLTLITLSLISLNAFASGWRGTDGWSGDNRTITAGPAYNIDLSGSDGSKGGDGRDGDTGYCGSRMENGQEVSENRQGGNGEDGGDGGNGGNGGDLTVLFTEYTELKNIRFVSWGGDGGYGGDGGDGGKGCPDGSDGRDGSRGSSGSSGYVYLVQKQHQPLQADNSRGYMKVGDLASEKNIVHRVWKRISGAELFARGSSFGYTYDLQGYEYGTARVEFTDPSMIDQKLLEDTMSVEMKDGVTTIAPGYSFSVVGVHSDPSPNAVLKVERLYNRYAFEGLRYKQIVNRKIQLLTSSELLPKPALAMQIKVEVRGNFWKYRTLFEGAVPEALISSLQNGYEIDMEALPLKEKIKKGATIRISMDYKISELTLEYKNKEVWVVGLSN